MRLRKSLLMQFTCRYVLLIVVSFTLVFGITISYMSQSISREQENVLHQKLDILSENLSDRLNTVMRIHSDIQGNSELQRLIASAGRNEDVSDEISRHLKKYRADSLMLSSVFLMDYTGRIIGRSVNSLATAAEEQEMHAVAKRFIDSKANRFFISTDSGKLVFLCALHPADNYRYSAVACVEVNRDRLFFDFLKAARSSFTEVYIVDDAGLITSSDKSAMLPEITDENQSVLRRGRDIYTLCVNVNSVYSGWKIIGLYDQNEAIAVNRRKLTSLIIVFLCTLAAAIGVGTMIARSISLPIKKLSDSVAPLASGRYPEPIAITRDDEIGVLIDAFNHAVSGLKSLNESILQEQQEKRRYEVSMLKTQLDLLQSQINPHFIHNTLNTLNYLALNEGNTELSHTITCFNSLLRASISTDREFNTVEEEIEYVREYMHIQKQRYADRNIEVSFSSDEESVPALLPRLILQPLVENSLFHGLLPCQRQKGIIRVVCLTQQEMLHVYIIDNGIGISAEMLDKINCGEAKVTNGYNHIGLNNVRERLNLMYHTACRFIILSQKDEGTTIYFCVPYRR